MFLVDQPVEIRFQSGAEIPPVEEGELETFVLAVRNPCGAIACFAVDYLNDFPLWCEPPEGYEGGNATGWFDHLPGDDGSIVRPLDIDPDQVIIGWCSMEEISRTLEAMKGSN